MAASRRFRPPWWGWLVAVAGVALFLNLANWQYQRGVAKEARIARTAAQLEQAPRRVDAVDALAAGPVELSGTWLGSRQLLLDNQTRERRVGYRVWSALDLGGDQPLVLVDRGWVPAPALRSELPDVALSAAAVTISGIWRSLPTPGLRLESAACAAREWPRRVNYPDQAELECILQRPVADGLLLLDPQHPQGYLRTWAHEELPASTHYGYALQWLALAITAVVLFVVLNLRRVAAR